MEMKDVVEMAKKIADQILLFKEQGYTDISIKQVNDPNDDNVLQEQLLVDMKKDGQDFEVRLFSKQKKGEVTLKTKKGKVNKKNGTA